MRHFQKFSAIAILSVLLATASELRGDERTNWWAFQAVQRPAVPEIGAANAIDAFVRARLAPEKFQPAPPAERRTLIRRACYDIIGLPPTFEEIEAFAEDNSPDAYGNLIDRLLASPHFGERWARHWLDVVRFAETNGYERDALKPNIWKYRDWVIGAFNNDLPYPEFVRHQLAGDEVPGRDKASVIATGMLRAGTWNDEPNDPQVYKYERLEDLVDVVGTAFLGVTVKCARCHDHKFDPILQSDYYRFAAAFWAGPIEPRDGKLMGGPTPEELGFDDVFGWTDRGREVPDFHLLEKGDPHNPGPAVAPGFLSLVSALDKPIEKPAAESPTTQRRLQLADRIADARNPLTARVYVNRLWQALFGHGIVRTPNNFGLKATLPTHPQLLDWLAAEFMDGGWKTKRVIKSIVMSDTYRQASVHPHQEQYAQRDSSNTLLWKMGRRRMDAETLRDAMLHVGGDLNLKSGGPSFYPHMSAEALEGFSRKGTAWTESPPDERRRRSIYMISKRHLLLPLMTAFDFPSSERPCGRRNVTTVAPQALALLNNQFVHERSQRVAEIAMAAAPELDARIQHAWISVLGRPPSAAELAAAQRHYRGQLALFSKPAPEAQPGVPKDGLALWLRAADGVLADKAGLVSHWGDRSEQHRDASQENSSFRPSLVSGAIGGKPALRFDGKSQFLKVTGQVLDSQAVTIVAVATDLATELGHREIFSNWDGAAGNSVGSIFLGLTGENTVRFSDGFTPAGTVDAQHQPSVLTATSGSSGAAVYQNGRQLAARTSPLAARRLNTAYVIGQQGNYNNEYWHGDIAEIIVFDRQLGRSELGAVWSYLADRYQIRLDQSDALPGLRAAAPEFLAMASLCHVLLNTNEFLYVD